MFMRDMRVLNMVFAGEKFHHSYPLKLSSS